MVKSKSLSNEEILGILFCEDSVINEHNVPQLPAQKIYLYVSKMIYLSE